MPRYRFHAEFTLPMPVTLADGQEYIVTICPVRYNRVLESVAGGDADQSAAEWLALVLSSVITAWDLEGADGQPIPLTRDAIKANVLVTDQNVIHDALMQVISPNPKATAQTAEAGPVA